MSAKQVLNAVISWLNIADRRHLSQVSDISTRHKQYQIIKFKICCWNSRLNLLVRCDEACRNLIDEAKSYMLLPQERPLMQGHPTRPGKPTRREEHFADGGWCSGHAIASVDIFDPQTNDWKMVTPMSKPRCDVGVAVAVLNDLIYAVGGHDGQSYLNSIERYDPQTNQARSQAKLLECSNRSSI